MIRWFFPARAVALLSLLPAFCLSSPLAATPLLAAELASQNALYDLKLVESAGGETLSATGSMAYSVQKTCAGWVTRQTLDIQSVTRKDGPTHMRSEYTTLESPDSRHLTFSTHETRDGQLLQALHGQASLNPDGSGTAHYDKPLSTTRTLPVGTVFPMAHMANLIAAMQAGKADLASPLFDGTVADGAEDTYATILHRNAPAPLPTLPPPAPDVASSQVHVGFFEQAGHAMTPVYELGMRVFTNGVSDALDMNFGDFRMQGTLHALTLPPTPTCPALKHATP